MIFVIVPTFNLHTFNLHTFTPSYPQPVETWRCNGDVAVQRLYRAPLSPLASRLSPLASRLSPLASHLSPLASHLSPLTSRLASRLSPLASYLSPLTSRLSPLASYLSPLTSRLSPLASCLSPLPSPLLPRNHSNSRVTLPPCNVRCSRRCASQFWWRRRRPNDTARFCIRRIPSAGSSSASVFNASRVSASTVVG